MSRTKKAVNEPVKTRDKKFLVVCSSCRTVIRTSTTDLGERMCLICHARMLNDYFRRIGGASLKTRRRQ
ncbi:MAG TPA: hypothetical protein VFH91_02400 [Pyrinomonadaceae bacterium]|nr:hypothetical protein [Pyrinomonadaceae bacterium]